MVDLTASRQSAECGVADDAGRSEKQMRSFCDRHACWTRRTRHSECFNQDAPVQALRWRGKISAAVRQSLGPPQWPDTVPARNARMNI